MLNTIFWLVFSFVVYSNASFYTEPSNIGPEGSKAGLSISDKEVEISNQNFVEQDTSDSLNKLIRELGLHNEITIESCTVCFPRDFYLYDHNMKHITATSSGVTFRFGKNESEKNKVFDKLMKLGWSGSREDFSGFIPLVADSPTASMYVLIEKNVSQDDVRLLQVTEKVLVERNDSLPFGSEASEHQLTLYLSEKLNLSELK